MPPTPRRLSTLMTALGWWWKGDEASSMKLQAMLVPQEAPPPPPPSPFADEIPEGYEGDGRWWLLTLPSQKASLQRIQQMRRTSLAIAWLDLAPPDLQVWAIEQLDRAPQSKSVKGILAALSLRSPSSKAPRPPNEEEKGWALGWFAALALTNDAKALLEEGVRFPEKHTGSWLGWLVLMGQDALLDLAVSKPGFSPNTPLSLTLSFTQNADELINAWRKALKKETGWPVDLETKEKVERAGTLDWSPYQSKPLGDWAISALDAPCLALLLKQGATFSSEMTPFSHVVSKQDTDCLRALLEAKIPMSVKSTEVVAGFMAQMERSGKENPELGWGEQFDLTAPLFDRALRVYVRTLEGSEWADIVTDVLKANAPKTAKMVVSHKPPAASNWVSWFNNLESRTKTGEVEKTHTTFLMLALKEIDPHKEDTVIAALVNEGVDISDSVRLWVSDTQKSLPMGMYIAALAPGSLKSWVDHASSASLQSLSKLRATSGVKKGEVVRIGKEDDIWCCALRSVAPHLALKALMSRGELVQGFASTQDRPHSVALSLAADMRWDALEAALEYLPPPVWNESTVLSQKCFQRPFDEGALFNMVERWPLHKVKVDNQGNTLLHKAIEKDEPDLVVRLIVRGADLDRENEEGVSPRMLASGYDNASMWEAHFAEGAARRLQAATSESSNPSPKPRSRL